ncbi:MAG: cysteine hydrolase [Clostridiales bacterium]|nr:cysteine hydrolase [Clostridiales bacterium]
MKKILVVVDYQRDFVDGALGFPGAERLEAPICARIEQVRAEGSEVVFTFDTHHGDYLETREGRDLPVPHCIKGSEGWGLYGGVAAHCDAQTRCFEKPTFGSFELAEYLRAGQYDEVELCGLVSNICVISNAALARAALPEAAICVDARCTGGGDPLLNEKALDVMQGFFIEVKGR